MKGIITIAILATLGIMALDFRRRGSWKKLLVSAALFASILVLAGLGAMTRTVIPIFIAHFILIVIAWGALLLYIFREKLYLPVILAPAVTIVLFILLERVAGSAGSGL